MAGEDVVKQLSSLSAESVDAATPPSAKVIEWLHGQSPTGRNDLHHRIGFGEDDASAGNHTHDGRNSPALFDSTLILTDLSPTASTAQIVNAVNAINALLRSKGAG